MADNSENTPVVNPLSKPKKRRLRRIVIGLLVFLLLLIVACGAAAAWLLYTDSGLRFAVNAAEDFTAGALQTEGVNGRLAGPLQIDRLVYRDDSVDFVGTNFELDWLPAAVFSGQAAIKHFRADKLELTVAETEDSDEPVVLPDIDLPLDIDVASLDIKQLVIRTGGQADDQTVGMEHVIDNIQLEAGTAGRRAGVRSLTLTYNNLPLDIAVTGDVDLGDQYPLDLLVDWHLRETAEYPAYRGQLDIAGKLGEQLAGVLSVNQPSEATLNFAVMDPLNAVMWQADININEALLNQWWPDLPVFAVGAQAKAQGDAEQATIEYLRVDTLDGRITSSGKAGWGESVSWDLQLTADNINPVGYDPELAGQISLNSQITGYIDTEGKPDITATIQRFNAKITGMDGQIPPMSGQGVARLQGDKLAIQELLVNTLQGQINLRGVATLAEPLQWKAQLDATTINPDYYDPGLTGSISLSAAIDGKINARGTPDLTADIASMSGHLQGFDGQVPKFSGNALARLDNQTLEIKRLVLNTLGGSINATGDLQLAEPLQWQARLNVQQVDPGFYDPELRGEWSLQVATTGSVANDDLAFEADIQQLDGRFRGRKITGNGTVMFADDWLNVNKLLLQSKGSPKVAMLSANGRVRLEQPFAGDLDFAVQIPELLNWLPDARGRVDWTGKLQGSGQELRLISDIEAGELEYLEYNLEQMAAKIDVDLNGQANSNVSITLQDSEVAGMTIQQATINLSGNAAQHTLDVDAQLAEAKTKLVLSGGATGRGDQLLTQGWQGTIQTFNLDTRDLANWRINEPLSIALNRQGPNDGLVLERGCFSSDQTTSELCMGGRYSDRSGANFSGTVKQVPIQLIEPFVPPEYKFEGELNGEFDFAAPTGSQPTGQLRITSTQGAVKTRLRTNDTTAFIYRNMEFVGNMASGEFRLTGGFDLADDGEAKATAEINIRLDDKLPIDGRIYADINRLAGISIFVPQLTDVRGNAEIDIQLSGTMSDPRFDGFVEIDAERADVIPLGARINDLYARADASSDGKITLLGEFLAGGGALDFSGEVQRIDQGWLGELKVQGEKVELLRTPDMKGRFSPDLVLQVNGNQMTINGELTLYDTELELKRFASVTRESNDVVIVGEIPLEELNSDADDEPLELTGSVNIVTGNPIAVLAEGLKAEVDGQLRLGLQPQGLPIGRGELNVAGKFEAYGQDLSIENSRIVFADVVVTNPRLAVEAVRRVDDVTVGVKITGAAENPRIEIFSRPAMAESEALAYLVLGRPLEDATSSEGNSLNNAAAALGAAGGNILGDWVGSRFGVDSVGFESNGEQVDFVLGTQLGERLFVNFRQGLFEPISALQLQYILNDRCNLEAETSSTGQGIDMKCRFERD